jgi:hypothetical protein
MGVARLKAVTGESVEIRFSIDPYVRGTTWIATPGSGGTRSTKATDIRVSLDVPPDRPLPDRVLVTLHAEPEEGPDREFQLTLEPTGERSYSGQIDCRLRIMSGGHGEMYSRQQAIEFVLIRGPHRETLVDPINRTTRFQINLDQASLSG